MEDSKEEMSIIDESNIVPGIFLNFTKLGSEVVKKKKTTEIVGGTEVENQDFVFCLY